ncbi:hypothetical protein C8J55DRAFT_492840 [Lentinula edodes]|uniref:C2H2-type domain-containing protein n=1 Tax=Lentinula lateritia TaxID=40482 RepID=A0A9W8ZVF2_9AGAR|nr:hypothetical protein C8J55DRAFT_492840 [Lentinula edodes]
MPHNCEQQTDSHINNAVLGWFSPPTFLAVEDSAIHTPDLDIRSKFKNSAEDMLLQSTEPVFSEASSGSSVCGVSRSSTPALSFASSRSSSRSPSTKLHQGPCLCNEDCFGIESFHSLAELNGTPSEASIPFTKAGSITTVGNDDASWDSPGDHAISGMYPNYSPPYPEFGTSYPSPPSGSSGAAPLYESNECFDDGRLINKETLAPPPSSPLRRPKRKVGSHRRKNSDDEYEEPEDTGDDETYDPASSSGRGNLTGKKRKAASYETTEERTCKKCGLVFTRSADIGRHCASAHSEMSEEMKQECTCILCLKRLARPDAMKRHLEARTKKCLLEAKRRKERGELDPVIYRLHLQSSC